MSNRLPIVALGAASAIFILSACGSDPSRPLAATGSNPRATGDISLEIPLAPSPTLDIPVIAPPELEGVTVVVGPAPGLEDDAEESAEGGAEGFLEEDAAPEENALSPCAIEATVENDTLGFEQGSSIISSGGDELVREFVARLVTSNRGRTLQLIEVDGYASSEGSEDYNLALSQARADAVGVLLTTMLELVGVPMTPPTGFGEADPVSENGTEEGRGLNRRVEMLFHFQGCED